MLLDVLLALWVLFMVFVGFEGGVTLGKNERVRGLPGVILTLVMFPVMGIVFLALGAILAFPLLYWLVF